MKKSLVVIFFVSVLASASDWSATDVQILNGDGFKDSPAASESVRTVWTFEHISGWTYGTNYFFFDVTNANKTNSTQIYGEFAPFISIPKMSGSPPEGGWVKDYGAAFNFELPMAPASRVNLYGIGVEWNMPYFSVFNTYLYSRDNLGESGQTAQFTLVWSAPFSFVGAEFLFNGFIDVTSSGEYAEVYVSTQPQILLDLDKTFGVKNVMSGIEYQIWQNKFGVKDWNEQALQYMIRIGF